MGNHRIGPNFGEYGQLDKKFREGRGPPNRVLAEWS